MRGAAERVALWVAAALAILAPLPIGGTPGLAKALLGALVVLGLGALLVAREPPAPPPRALAILLALSLLLCVVYLVPLPYPVVEALSPRLADAAASSLVAPENVDESLAAADEALMESVGAEAGRPAWRPLAVDPDGAWEGALRLSASFGALLLTLLAVRGPRDRRFLVAVLAVSAFIQAGYGIAEYFGGRGTILDLDKSYYSERATGTFVNPNHFGTLLFLGLFALVGILASGAGQDDEDDLGRPAHRKARLSALATMGGVIVVALLWSMSRGALSCAALGLVLFLVFGLTLRGSDKRLLYARLLLGLVAAALVAGAIWLKPPDPVLDRFGMAGAALPDRARIWKATLDIAADYPATGSGLGTLRYVESLYRPPDMENRAIHAHNDYVQWIAETGVPGTLLLLAWIVVLARGTLQLLVRPGERAMSAALAAGLVALALHESVEFSLQLLGVSLPAAVMVGALLAPLAWRGPTSEHRKSEGPLAWRIVAPLALVIVLVSALGFAVLRRPLPTGVGEIEAKHDFRMRSADALRRWARSEVSYVTTRAATEHPLDRDEAERRLGSALRAARCALARAPLRGEAHLTVWAAAQSLAGARLPTPPPPGFVELMRHHLLRAEELAPTSRARHLQLIRYWLLAGDNREARRLARRLLELRPWLHREVYDVLGGPDLDLGELMEATPNEPDAAYLLASYMRRRKDDVGAAIVLERALERHPESLRLKRALADVLAARGETRAALELLPDVSEAEDRAERLRVLRLRAALMIREKRFDELDAVVAAQVDAGEDPYLLAAQVARALVSKGSPDDAIETLREALARREPPMSPNRKLSLLIQLGTTLEHEKRHREALLAFREAAKIDPEHGAVKAYFRRLDRALPGR